MEPPMDAAEVVVESISAPADPNARLQQQTTVERIGEITPAAILPIDSATGNEKSLPKTRQTDVLGPLEDGFFATFGALGIPMVAAFVLSALAMFNQAMVQIFPDYFANWLMNTGHYDDGDFWLLEVTDRGAVVVAAIVLVFFGCCYIWLAALMLCLRHRALPRRASAVVSQKAKVTVTDQESRVSTGTDVSDMEVMDVTFRDLLRSAIATRFGFRMEPSTNSEVENAETPKTQSKTLQRVRTGTGSKMRRRAKTAAEIYGQFSNIDGVYHSYYSALYDLPKLLFQTVTLYQYLRKGFPGVVIAFYATMLLFNWIISFYRFQQKAFDRHLIVARVFYLFDLFFAVFAPLVVIIYAVFHFNLDHAAFDARLDVLRLGDYDRNARLFADPKEMSLFRAGFGHLVLSSSGIILIKGGLLYLSIYKWRKIVRYLIQSHHKERLLHQRRQLKLNQFKNAQRVHGDKDAHNSSASTPVDLNTLGPITIRRHARHHLLMGIILFLCWGSAILIYTITAYFSVQSNCHAHPKCAVVSYQWYAGYDGCPCVAFIDRNLAPRTFAEWIAPVDVTMELSLMSNQGMLKTVQIVNRQLTVIPDDLRRCTSLEQMILIYTHIETLPTWFSEFHNLNYLHIEGDFTSRGLKTISADIFQHMAKLRFLHTGVLPQLVEYPSLVGLSKLKSLTITSAHLLPRLPSFDSLTSLKALTLVDNPHLQELPSLHHLQQLKSFVLTGPHELCCNGFASGTCDLTDPHCQREPGSASPNATCTSRVIDPQDLETIDRVDGPFCEPLSHHDDDDVPTIESSDGACAGVLYRQCHLRGTAGICYNSRMQVIHCDVNSDYEGLRRLQISRGVGGPCDPVVEAWLGCPAR